LLEVNRISVYYGKAIALDRISLRIDKKETVGLIGPNGAGKTTLLNTVMGLLRPKTGGINFMDERIDGLPPHILVKKRIALCPESRRVATEMTVNEFLHMGAYARKDKGKIQEDFERVFKLFPELEERKSQLCGTLSGGEQQMVSIGRALMSDPILLMLDEPSLGLAPLVKTAIFEEIKRICEIGISILLVEQDASLALRTVDRAYVLEAGRIVLEGKSENLWDNVHVKEAYLGI